MVAQSWLFDPQGPSAVGLTGPVALSRSGMGLPPRPGFYVVTAGPCMGHVGASKRLRSHVGNLARLGTHRGSAEVLCAAYCAHIAPVVWWEETTFEADARSKEAAFKEHYGEAPQPSHDYARCVNGKTLREAFVAAAGMTTWEAGYAEAVFTIGEKLALLFAGRFHDIWDKVGVPPGPWAAD